MKPTTRYVSVMKPLMQRLNCPTVISLDRYLPDKAIDLIDEAASRVRLQSITAPRFKGIGG